MTLCNSSILQLSCGQRTVIQLSSSTPCLVSKRKNCYHGWHSTKLCRRLVVLAVTEGYAKSSESDERIPSWAQPDSDEPLPWARDKAKKLPKQQ